MKQHRLFILALVALVSLVTYGQLFKPLGLGIETSRDMVGEWYQPQIHVEGDILYVCTKQGLYSKDLSSDESEWQLVGFEGIPLQDYARSGDDMLALRHCYYVHSEFLLLSHDGGKTYEDITPAFFKGRGYAFVSLNQHPTDPNILLTSTSSGGNGILLTTDFGQTWNKLSPFTPEYTGFHPLTPEIIYESYGEHLDEITDLHISYDGGQTWQNKSSYLPEYVGIYRMAFHPANPNRWIAGGTSCVHSTNDNGQTWETQSLRDYNNPLNDAYLAPWRYAIYDNENPDIVYMAACSRGDYMRLMCSTDGGTTWNKPHLEPIKTTPTEFVFDMKQYGDKLLIYSQSDVYVVSKAELIEETSDEPAKEPIEINETTFPDENFRNWVLAQSYGQDGILTDEEIAGVTKINVSIRGIQSLKGIEYFTELTTLYCTVFQLEELDVSRCTKLEWLDCSWNQLTSLDVSNNTALKELYCHANQLTSLDVSQNTALVELYCNMNQLTALDVSNNIELNNLDCHDNQLTELDVSKNTKQRRILCTGNLLTSLDVSCCSVLESLKCGRNRLTTLEVSGCPELWEIFCYNNQIRGEAMDALIDGLAFIPEGWGHLCIVNTEDEQNVMTKAQVAAAKAKGWNPRYTYGAFGYYGFPDYEGIDDPTGIGGASHLNDKGQMINDKWYDIQGHCVADGNGQLKMDNGQLKSGIYIVNGKKILVK